MVLGVLPVIIEISFVERFTRNKVARYFSPCVRLGCCFTSFSINSLFINMNRYRLRKSLNLSTEEDLTTYLQSV